jgi:general secretion pathway protein K
MRPSFKPLRQGRQAPPSTNRPGGDCEAGTILIFVLWILVLLSTLVLSWAHEWRTEIALTRNFQEASRCRRLAEAGVYYAAAKMVEAKAVTDRQAPGGGLDAFSATPEVWRGDQSLHVLELPGGQVEMRVADEGGKINLNLASDQLISRLFTIMGYNESQVQAIAAAILDWRSPGEVPRAYGAKSSYYLGLDPPYPARNDRFEVVGELGWVQPFIGSPLPRGLEDWLTVQTTSKKINVNTAPLEVLLACGLSPEAARTLIDQRQNQPFRSLSEVRQLVGGAGEQTLTSNLTWLNSLFFTIQSTGLVKKGGGRHTIRAVIRLKATKDSLWDIVSWIDDYPG